MRGPVVLQAHAAECALASLAMVLGFHGQHTGLADLRRRCGQQSRGTSLKALIGYARQVGLHARPLRAGLEDLGKLSLPCILHWNFNHFVVLEQVHGGRSITIADPAVGRRRLSLTEASTQFTGVALELSPGDAFQSTAAAAPVRLRQLTGRIVGLGRSLAKVAAVALALEVFVVIAPLLNQLVVDDVIVSHDQHLLVVLILGFGLLLLLQCLLGLARSWMLLIVGQSLALEWLTRVFAHLLRLPMSFFAQRHLGDVISRFHAVREIQRTLTSASVEALLDGLMALAALAMMLLYAPTLAVVVILAVTVYGLLRWAAWAPLRTAASERLVLAAKESSYFIETLRAMQPLKLFGREHDRLARWQNLVVDVQNRELRTARLAMWLGTAQMLIFGLENLAVVYLGARLVMEPSVGGSLFTVGMLFAFLSYKGQFTQRVAGLIDFVAEFRLLGLHAERLADIVLTESERDTPDGDLPLNDLSHLPASLALRGVSFRYGDNEPWLLRQVDLDIEAGQSVAIVGPSGAGKTTLLKLILGLLAPTEGQVLYGGVPVAQLGRANVRRQIATVMQDDQPLSGSLAENISFFDNEPDRQRVEDAARLAKLHDDIVRMPMGYETVLGDAGQGLSGGQRQRLMLARALYRQPAVLALDEASSQLDLATEQAVHQALADLPVTRVLIAHRPETIASAQRVVILHGGTLTVGAGDRGECYAPRTVECVDAAWTMGAA